MSDGHYHWRLHNCYFARSDVYPIACYELVCYDDYCDRQLWQHSRVVLRSSLVTNVISATCHRHWQTMDPYGYCSLYYRTWPCQQASSHRSHSPSISSSSISTASYCRYRPYLTHLWPMASQNRYSVSGKSHGYFEPSGGPRSYLKSSSCCYFEHRFRLAQNFDPSFGDADRFGCFSVDLSHCLGCKVVRVRMICADCWRIGAGCLRQFSGSGAIGATIVGRWWLPGGKIAVLGRYCWCWCDCHLRRG